VGWKELRGSSQEQEADGRSREQEKNHLPFSIHHFSFFISDRAQLFTLSTDERDQIDQMENGK
jgi:hypothetical protein